MSSTNVHSEPVCAQMIPTKKELDFPPKGAKKIGIDLGNSESVLEIVATESELTKSGEIVDKNTGKSAGIVKEKSNLKKVQSKYKEKSKAADSKEAR